MNNKIVEKIVKVNASSKPKLYTFTELYPEIESLLWKFVHKHKHVIGEEDILGTLNVVAYDAFLKYTMMHEGKEYTFCNYLHSACANKISKYYRDVHSKIQDIKFYTIRNYDDGGDTCDTPGYGVFDHELPSTIDEEGYLSKVKRVLSKIKEPELRKILEMRMLGFKDPDIHKALNINHSILTSRKHQIKTRYYRMYLAGDLF